MLHDKQHPARTTRDSIVTGHIKSPDYKERGPGAPGRRPGASGGAKDGRAAPVIPSGNRRSRKFSCEVQNPPAGEC